MGASHCRRRHATQFDTDTDAPAAAAVDAAAASAAPENPNRYYEKPWRTDIPFGAAQAARLSHAHSSWPPKACGMACGQRTGQDVFSVWALRNARRVLCASAYAKAHAAALTALDWAAAARADAKSDGAAAAAGVDCNALFASLCTRSAPAQSLTDAHDLEPEMATAKRLTAAANYTFVGRTRVRNDELEAAPQWTDTVAAQWHAELHIAECVVWHLLSFGWRICADNVCAAATALPSTALLRVLLDLPERFGVAALISACDGSTAALRPPLLCALHTLQTVIENTCAAGGAADAARAVVWPGHVLWCYEPNVLFRLADATPYAALTRVEPWNGHNALHTACALLYPDGGGGLGRHVPPWACDLALALVTHIAAREDGSGELIGSATAHASVDYIAGPYTPAVLCHAISAELNTYEIVHDAFGEALPPQLALMRDELERVQWRADAQRLALYEQVLPRILPVPPLWEVVWGFASACALPDVRKRRDAQNRGPIKF